MADRSAVFVKMPPGDFWAFSDPSRERPNCPWRTVRYVPQSGSRSLHDQRSASTPQPTVRGDGRERRTASAQVGGGSRLAPGLDGVPALPVPAASHPDRQRRYETCSVLGAAERLSRDRPERGSARTADGEAATCRWTAAGYSPGMTKDSPPGTGTDPLPVKRGHTESEITHTDCQRCGAKVWGVNARYACHICGWVSHWSSGTTVLPTAEDDVDYPGP